MKENEWRVLNIYVKFGFCPKNLKFNDSVRATPTTLTPYFNSTFSTISSQPAIVAHAYSSPPHPKTKRHNVENMRKSMVGLL